MPSSKKNRIMSAVACPCVVDSIGAMNVVPGNIWSTVNTCSDVLVLSSGS